MKKIFMLLVLFSSLYGDLTYNETGAIITKTTNGKTYHFTYDDSNQLLQTSTDDLDVYYHYDRQGRRISKTIIQNENEETEYYIYSGDNEIAVLDSNGEVKHQRMPGNSFHQSVIISDAIVANGTSYHPIYNSSFNIIKLISDNEEISYENLSPFGENLAELNPITPWIFACKHYDHETNLVYFGHRYYDPSLKQWLTPDPLSQTENPYTYCNNDPTKYFDPEGRWSIAIPIVIQGTRWAAAVAAAATAAAIGWGVEKVTNYFNETKEEEKRLEQEKLKKEEQFFEIQKNQDKYKKPKVKTSAKEGAKDVPSWAKGERPYKNEAGNDFAKRLLDEKYGSGNYRKGPNSEFNQIRKWGDRAWE